MTLHLIEAKLALVEAIPETPARREAVQAILPLLEQYAASREYDERACLGIVQRLEAVTRQDFAPLVSQMQNSAPSISTDPQLLYKPTKRLPQTIPTKDPPPYSPVRNLYTQRTDLEDRPLKPQNHPPVNPVANKPWPTELPLASLRQLRSEDPNQQVKIRYEQEKAKLAAANKLLRQRVNAARQRLSSKAGKVATLKESRHASKIKQSHLKAQKAPQQQLFEQSLLRQLSGIGGEDHGLEEDSLCEELAFELRGGLSNYVLGQFCNLFLLKESYLSPADEFKPIYADSSLSLQVKTQLRNGFLHVGLLLRNERTTGSLSQLQLVFDEDSRLHFSSTLVLLPDIQQQGEWQGEVRVQAKFTPFYSPTLQINCQGRVRSIGLPITILDFLQPKIIPDPALLLAYVDREAGHTLKAAVTRDRAKLLAMRLGATAFSQDYFYGLSTHEGRSLQGWRVGSELRVVEQCKKGRGVGQLLASTLQSVLQ